MVAVTIKRFQQQILMREAINLFVSILFSLIMLCQQLFCSQHTYFAIHIYRALLTGAYHVHPLSLCTDWHSGAEPGRVCQCVPA